MLSRRLFVAAAVALALAGPARAADAFPVTLTHAFGDTTIAAAPVRIVTIGWMSQDAVLALGQVPVAIPEQKWGGNERGVLPWVADAVSALGGPEPRIINFDSDIPYEDVLATAPDLILAPYSGLTEEQYTRLSAIAPTVAYAKAAWAASWQEVMLTVGKALGKSAEAEALIAATSARLADAASAHPEFAGKTFTFGSLWVGDPGMNVYSKTDPRVYLVEQLGLTASAGVEELSKQPGYYFTVSFENLASVDADVLIALDEGDAASDALYQNPLVQRFKPVAEGRLVRMTDKSFVMATSAPSVLSIPWMLDRFIPELAARLK